MGRNPQICQKLFVYLRVMRVELQLAHYCERNGLLKALWVYNVLRRRGKNTAGYSYREDRLQGIKKRQVQRYYAKLQELGWANITTKSCKIKSIRTICSELGLKSRYAVEVPESVLYDYKKFKSFLFSARLKLVTNKQTYLNHERNKRIRKLAMRAQAKREPVNIITPNTFRVYELKDVLTGIHEYSNNQVSLSVISGHTGMSRTQVQRLKSEAQKYGFLDIRKNFVLVDPNHDPGLSHPMFRKQVFNRKRRYALRHPDTIKVSGINISKRRAKPLTRKELIEHMRVRILNDIKRRDYIEECITYNYLHKHIDNLNVISISKY